MQKMLSRPVTSIHWSNKYTELLCASYASDENSSLNNEPDGSVLIWNCHLPSRPEYHFTSQTTINIAQFHPGSHKLIVGGGENGQIVIWDMRANKSTPVNRTSLAHGHTHPITAMNIIQLASGAYNIVTVSTDGHVCTWNDLNLYQPTNEQHLYKETKTTVTHTTKEEITSTCFDFPGRDNNTLYLGSVSS